MENVLNLVTSFFGEKNVIDTSPTFLLPNGKFLELKAYQGHTDVESYLYELGQVETYQPGFGSPAIQKLGCIRMENKGYLPYIELSNIQPTQSQYKSLEAWLDYTSCIANKIHIMPYRQQGKFYSFKEYITDDIVKRVKRYYSSGQLLENID